MTAYTVHHSARTPNGIMRDPDDVVLIKEGFAWAAFAAGPFWLLAKGLWLTAASYIFAVGAVMRLLETAAAPGSVLCVILAGVHFLLGCEANNLRRWKHARRGRRETSVVIASSLSEAERRLFASAIAPAGETGRREARGATSSPQSTMPLPRDQNQVGFFAWPGDKA